MYLRALKCNEASYITEVRIESTLKPILSFCSEALGCEPREEGASPSG